MGVLGALLGPLGRLLDATCEKAWVHPLCWGPTWTPKSTQVGSKILEKSFSKQTLILKRVFYVFFTFFIDFQVQAKITDFVKNSVFPKENHVFLEFRTPWEGTFSELSDFRKGWILGRKNLPKLRSKSIKIDLNFHIEIYLKFSSVLVVGGNFPSDFFSGGVHPTSKDGSALDYPSSSKISTFPNVWSSDLFKDFLFL